MTEYKKLYNRLIVCDHMENLLSCVIGKFIDHIGRGNVINKSTHIIQANKRRVEIYDLQTQPCTCLLSQEIEAS